MIHNSFAYTFNTAYLLFHLHKLFFVFNGLVYANIKICVLYTDTDSLQTNRHDDIVGFWMLHDTRIWVVVMFLNIVSKINNTCKSCVLWNREVQIWVYNLCSNWVFITLRFLSSSRILKSFSKFSSLCSFHAAMTCSLMLYTFAITIDQIDIRFLMNFPINFSISSWFVWVCVLRGCGIEIFVVFSEFVLVTKIVYVFLPPAAILCLRYFWVNWLLQKETKIWKL